ncbi:SH3 domain-containing protein [Nitrosomonas sp. PY1]|uniref:SH3 domain-containing protein n=1 Tax=Nitrosomonas sp. PY1 TaxID=1803906 RepID=UPI001FC7F1F8|nr:SH3 domain-containing protein [Nitrosomonas sp. PY1]GKS68094.1 SH3 domain-containing protein [Nitrosomonas sp. PY1]
MTQPSLLSTHSLVSQAPLSSFTIKFFYLFAVVIASGCASQEKILIPADEPKLPMTSESEKNWEKEVTRLEKLVAEKDQLIKNQKVQQTDQANVIRETHKEVARTQVKLHRLATKPGTASAIAELEASLNQLSQEKNAPFDQVLRMQAQRLSEISTIFYTKDQYATAMNYVGQANSFVKSIQSDLTQKKATNTDYPQLDFHVPVKLRTNKLSKLYKTPDAQSQVLLSLKKDTVLKATASQGTWLKVLTGKNQGWIQSTGFELE